MAKAFGIHELELRPGASPEEFARLAQEIADDPLPGLRIYVLQGDRGPRAGKFTILYEFTSVERRDALFPVADTQSAEMQQYSDSPATRRLWEQWDRLASLPGAPDTTYSDYVLLAEGGAAE